MGAITRALGSAERVFEASNSLTKCLETASLGWLPVPSLKVAVAVAEEGLRLGFDLEEDLGGREKESFMVWFWILQRGRTFGRLLLLAMFKFAWVLVWALF